MEDKMLTIPLYIAEEIVHQYEIAEESYDHMELLDQIYYYFEDEIKRQAGNEQ